MKKIFVLASFALLLGATSCANKNTEKTTAQISSQEEIQKIEKENIELDNLDKEINNDIEEIDSILNEID